MSRRLLLLALVAGCTRPAAAPPPDDATRLGPLPPAEVRTVVTLAPSLTAVVLALGGGDRLVGVTRFDEDPRVAALPRVGGFSDPSPETILRLRPDVVLCQPSPGNRGAVEAVAGAGIPVAVLPLEEKAAEVVDTIRRVGALLGLPDAAARLVAGIDAARARAAAAAKRRPRPVRVAVLYDLDPLIAAGPGSYPHALLEDAGAVNVVAASPQRYPRVSVETLLAARPDALLLAGADDHAAKRGGLPAPLEQRITSLRSRAFLQPGPGLPEALDELSDVLDRLAAAPP